MAKPLASPYTCLYIPSQLSVNDSGLLHTKHNNIDVDECKEDLNQCSHICFNMKGSYQCTCSYGYYLDHSDNSTCHGEHINPYIMLVLSQKLTRICTCQVSIYNSCHHTRQVQHYN